MAKTTTVDEFMAKFKDLSSANQSVMLGVLRHLEELNKQGISPNDDPIMQLPPEERFAHFGWRRA